LKKIFTYSCYLKNVCVLLLLSLSELAAQDIQFSQFYAAPLYLNPAFAGTTYSNRIIFQQRIQWPSLDAKYLTSLVSFDKNFHKYNSGLGIILSKDYQGADIIGSQDINLLYAYELQLNKNYALRTGLQLGYVSRYVNYADLTFPSQYTDRGYMGPGQYSNYGSDRVAYADVSSGLLFYSSRFWFSFASHHMNRPQQSFYNEVSRLPIKFSFGTGYKIPILKNSGQRKKDEEIMSITPVAHYKFQGKSDQLDVGLYAIYQRCMVGSWYRGIPIKRYKPDLQNNESVVVFAGFKLADFSLGYSYDFTLSRLAIANTGGSHEINITFEYPRDRSKKGRRSFPCPRFYEKR
jgi:type IX secretion system PorP/SprF family membrane protein